MTWRRIGWMYLLLARLGIVFTVEVGILLWSRLDEGNTVYPYFGAFSLIAVASGPLGYWFAYRLEKKRVSPGRREFLLIWLGAAPESLLYVPVFVVSLFALPFERGPLLISFVTLLVYASPLVVMVGLQGLATRWWLRRLEPSSAGRT
jgi:hypothetical protein